MPTPNPFSITIYDKAFARVGYLNDPVEIRATPRRNAVGTTEIVVPVGHRQCGHLEADGARVVIDYNGERLMSGPVHDWDGSGSGASGTFTYTVRDDLWLLERMLGWCNPGSAITAQTSASDSRTGAAETVAKGFITANKANMYESARITVATDLARGSTITVETRMANLADALLAAVDKAGLGISVTQSGSGYLVDVYEPATFPRSLSEQAGTVLSWGISKSVDTATRTVVGDQGTTTSRTFVQRGAGGAREVALGYTIGSFTDASEADTTGKMNAAGDAFLATAGPTAGFRVTLSETSVFRYGAGGVHVGDLVTVKVGGRTLTDVLREVTLTYTREEGLTVAPVIGERSNDPNRKFVQYVSAVARGLRKLRTR